MLPKPYMGILPFEATDDSILLKSTLMSAAEITAPLIGSAGSLTGSGHVFDPVKGYANPAAGACGVRWLNLTGFAALDYAGQMSVEMERQAVAAFTSAYGSQGDNPTVDYGGQSIAYMLVWTSDSGTTWGALRKVSGDPNGLVFQSRQAGETNGSYPIHDQLKGDFVRVTLSWAGGKMDFFVDGIPVTGAATPTRNTAWANQFATLWVNNFNGNNGVRGRFMRNLIVSKNPVMLPKHPSIRFALYGHSFAMTYGDSASSGAYDETFTQRVRRAAVRAGFDISTSVDGASGGYVISALTGAATQLRNATYLTSLNARCPTHIALLAGTNDVGNAGFVAANFETDYRALITSIMAGSNAALIKKLGVMRVPSRSAEAATWTPTVQANITAANAVIDALVAWFNTTFPTRAGTLSVLDMFGAWGGMTPTAKVMVGQMSGLANNLHPSPLGVGLCDPLLLPFVFE